MIPSLRIANFPIILEKTKLEDAQKHFNGTIGSEGDAGDAMGWLCLHGNDANGPWIFWLTSAEIDGPMIGGFTWKRLASNEIPDRRCRSVGKSAGGIELPLALHPGMSEAEARKILGQPTVIRGKTVIFCHSHPMVIDKMTYDSSNTVAVVLHGGSVQTIQASKTTTN